MSFAAVCATRSLTVGMPSGRSPPPGFGTRTLPTGWGRGPRLQLPLQFLEPALVAVLLDLLEGLPVDSRGERGLRTGAGASFGSVSVRWLQCATKLKSLKELLRAAGWITGHEMQARLGVSGSALGKRRLWGQIKARICNEMGERLYQPPEGLPSSSPPPSEAAEQPQKDSFNARSAV